MARTYPRLPQEQIDKIIELGTAGKKPKEIAEQLGIQHARQVQGYLARYVYGKPKPNKPEQPTNNAGAPENPTATNPSRTATGSPKQAKPENPEQINPKGGEKEVALEEKDVEKIVSQVSQVVAQAVGPAVGSAVENVLTKQEDSKHQKELEQTEKKVAEERIAKSEKKLEEVVTTVKTMEDFCKRFPELCDQVKDLSDAMKKPPEKPKDTEEAHKEPVHSTAREYFECPECSNPLITAQSKMIKENDEFAKRVYDAFKDAGALETFEKFKEKPEEKKEEKLTVV